VVFAKPHTEKTIIGGFNKWDAELVYMVGVGSIDTDGYKSTLVDFLTAVWRHQQQKKLKWR
jgi:hypothetical protein